MNLYETPKSQVETEHHVQPKRWNVALAFKLFTIPYLLFLFISIFMGIWYGSYLSMLSFMKTLESKSPLLVDGNIFMHMFSWGYIPGSLIIMIITGLIPVGFVSYFQTKKSAWLFQFVWFMSALLLFCLFWYKRF